MKIQYIAKSSLLQVLEIFGKRSDPSTWQSKLMQALRIVRRRDLTELVDELLNTK